MSDTNQYAPLVALEDQMTKQSVDHAVPKAEQIPESDSDAKDAQKPKRIPNSFLLSCSRFITENEQDIFFMVLASVMFILAFALTAYLRRDEEFEQGQYLVKSKFK